MLLLSERTLRACRLNGREAVVCAFSGGPDPTALLLEWKRLRDEGTVGPLYAAHFEHGIRGEEARADRDFCRKLCLDLGVPLFSEGADVPAYAKAEGLSLETAARQLRYAFLRRLKTALGAEVIALGHHRDDQAETVLLHLVRGSGRKGPTGMAFRSGDLVRPLLDVGKDDILVFLAERDQPYRLDSTNALTDAARNRLRQGGMEALKAVNPRAAEHIAACADRLRAEDEFLDDLARQALTEAHGSRSALAKLPSVLRNRAALLLLRSITDDFTEADVDRLVEVFSQPSGRTASLRGNLIARAEGDRLSIGPATAAEAFAAELTPGRLVTTPWGVYEARWAPKAAIPCPADEAYLDGDRIVGGLTLRQARVGERFVPLGMAGSKLLSDYYTDRKLYGKARQTPLVCDGEGPLFVPGGTVADRAKITEGTKHILHIIFTKGEERHEEMGT